MATGSFQVSEKEAWRDQAHVETFDFMHDMPDLILRTHYESFNEGRLLKKYSPGITGKKFYEIGCATGELYRYLRSSHSQFNYCGFDISEPAIQRAKQKYPEASFHLLAGGFEELHKNYARPDVVWCRDVVFHQNDPYAFLDNLIRLANQGLFVRLRTRDVGATVADAAISCQLHWDKSWVPYIVLNADEMISRIEAHEDVAGLVVSRAYEVLGGQNYRFLPKELYFSNAKSAETALYIQKGQRPAGKLEVSFADQPDRPQYGLGENAIRALFMMRRKWRR